MRDARRLAVVMLATLLAVARPGLAQGAPASAPPPVLSPAEMEQFLLNGKIVATRKTKTGVTNAKRVTLSDGRLTHDAQVQDVDIALPLFEVGPKYTEVNFKDSYRYNIAGYRLAQLLGLDNVPMSVERKVDGKQVSMTWWVDGIVMDEGERKKKGTAGASPSRTAAQFHTLRVFDELIQNRDRNGGNILWAADGTLWMIDHTRAFRLGKDLLKAAELQRCDRTLFSRMKDLTSASMVEVMGKVLTKGEIEALLARRDLIVRLFETKIAERGEAAVLFDLPR
jgi:hypothetical protein